MRKGAAFLGAIALVFGGLVAGGCASDNEPYGLTGSSSSSDQRWVNQKGQGRPDWQAGVNRPAGYPNANP